MAKPLEGGQNLQGGDGPLAAQILRAGHVPHPSGAGLHVGLRWATSPRTSTRATSGSRDSTSSAMGYDAPSAFPPSSMRSDRAASRRHDRAEHRPLPRTAGQDRILVRLGPRGACDPGYYKWTQWAFLEMFSHWYDRSKQQARPVAELTAAFETGGTEGPERRLHDRDALHGRRMERQKQAGEEQILQNRLTPSAPTPRSTGVRSWGPCWPTTKCTTDFRSAAAIRSSRSA